MLPWESSALKPIPIQCHQAIKVVHAYTNSLTDDNQVLCNYNKQSASWKARNKNTKKDTNDFQVYILLQIINRLNVDTGTKTTTKVPILLHCYIILFT